MDLDDQLAALAAGELDADEARALTARVGSDPALQRRLARITRLDQVLAAWDAPPLSPEAAARIDASVADALAALPDGPLVTGEAATPLRRLRPLADPSDEPDAAPSAAASATSAPVSDDVVDLATARARRGRGGVPRWVAGLGVAAAAFAVVGTAGQLLTTSADRAETDDLAGATMADTAEESLPEASFAEGPLTLAGVAYDEATLDTLAGLVPNELARTDDAASSGLADSGPADDGPDSSSDGGQTTGGGDTSAELAPQADELQAPGAGCLDEALATGLGRPVLLADGSYAGEPASFVVLESLDDQTTTLTTFAYAADGCSLLATRTSTR